MRDHIIWLAIAAAFLMVVTIGLPLIQGDSGRSRLKAIQARRSQFKQSVKDKAVRTPSLRDRLMKQTLSQKISRSLRFDRLFNMDTVRGKLTTAGWRDPNTVSKYLLAHIVVPVVLVGYFGFMLYLGPLKASLSADMKPLALGGCLLVGFFLPSLLLSNASQNRQIKLSKQYPDALDLMLVCVEAGLAVEQAFMRVTEEIGETIPEVAEEFALTGAELAYLGDRRQAFENLQKRTKMNEFQQLSTVLTQAEQFGTSVADALRTLSAGARQTRMNAVEKTAAGLGPKMTVPMILFILPCMFLVLLGPSIIKIMELK